LVLKLPSFGQDRDKEEQVGTQAAFFWVGQREGEQVGTQAAPIGQDKDEEVPVGTQAAAY
jgi:hypothetical protein